MRLSKIWQFAILFSTLVAGINMAKAQESTSPIQISGNVAVVSDYVFRGISQSDEDPVLQGGVDFRLPRGFYAGLWASGVDTPWGGVYNQVPAQEDFEYRLYAGWRWLDITESLMLDAGVIQYAFSDDPDDLTWSEFYVAASIDNKFRLKVSTQIDGLDFGTYYEASFRQPLPQDFDANFHLGYFDIENRLVRETEEYYDYSLGIGRVYKGFRFDLTYHKTDADGRQRYLDVADGRLTLSIRRDFELFPNFQMFKW